MRDLRNIEHPFLAGMDQKNRNIFLLGAKEKEFAADEIIFREGEPANTLYLIETGEVALEARRLKHRPVLIQTVQAGDALGWSWLFPPFAWHFQARATQPVRAICCDGGHLLVQAEEDPDFGYTVMRRVTQILINRLQLTRGRLIKEQAAMPDACGVP